ncbi:MAG: leucine-rich repeat protein, partial [Ruminococcus sp.]
MKKLLSLLLTIVIMLTALSVIPSAGAVTKDFAKTVNVLSESATSGTTGDCKWAYDASAKALTVYGKGKMEDYSDQKNAPWYELKDKIDSIVIENGVTAIGDFAFNNCTTVSKVTIPESVTRIGEKAFDNCNKLDGVYITSLKSWCNTDFVIGYDAPDNNLECSANPLVYGGNLYLNGEPVRDLVISDDIKRLGGYSASIGDTGESEYYASPFIGCKCIESVTISDSVISIEDGAFYGCTGLTTVIMGNNVAYVGDKAFYGCTSLTIVKIGNSVDIIGEYAFSRCSSLIGVIIPDSVTEIGDYAFKDCTKLGNVTLPNNLTNIGREMFRSCTNLTKVTIPDSVTGFGDYAFYNCSSLTAMKISDKVKYVGDWAFFNCGKLTSVTIGKCVKGIGYGSFSGCKGLKDVYYNGSIEQWKQINIYNSNDGLLGANIHCAYKASQKITGVKTQYVTKAGKSFSLKPKANTKLTYTSSNKNVAVVSSNGKVTVKGGGCAYITVKASGNENYKSATVKTKIISAPRNFTSKDVSKETKTSKTKAKITWKSLAGAKGYTVQLATKKSYKGAKTVKNSKNSATLTGLKKGKTYYVRISAYTKVSGKNYSNKWYTVK